MKIAVAAEGIPNLRGGLGYFVVRALEGIALHRPDWVLSLVATSSFKELDRIGAGNVRVIYWDRSRLHQWIVPLMGLALRVARKSIEPSYAMIRLASRGDLQPKALRRVWEDLAAVDAVWIPTYAIAYARLSPPAISPAMRESTLLTIHDIHPALFPEDWSPAALTRFWSGLVPFARGCGRIMTHSEYQKDLIASQLGIARERIAVAGGPPLIHPSALDAAWSPQEANALLLRLGIARDFVLYPGSTTHSHKNHTRLLLAWREVRRVLGRNCPLLVCTAKGHRWNELRRLIRELDLDGSVVFTDLVGTHELTMLLKACMLVVAPTLYEGGGSGPVADACLAGRPVLCSDIPPIREQLENYGGISVSYFDPLVVGSIVEGSLRALREVARLNEAAKQNRQALQAATPGIWANWVAVWSKCIEEIASRSTHDSIVQPPRRPLKDSNSQLATARRR